MNCHFATAGAAPAAVGGGNCACGHEQRQSSRGRRRQRAVGAGVVVDGASMKLFPSMGRLGSVALVLAACDGSGAETAADAGAPVDAACVPGFAISVPFLVTSAPSEGSRLDPITGHPNQLTLTVGAHAVERSEVDRGSGPVPSTGVRSTDLRASFSGEDAALLATAVAPDLAVGGAQTDEASGSGWVFSYSAAGRVEVTTKGPSASIDAYLLTIGCNDVELARDADGYPLLEDMASTDCFFVIIDRRAPTAPVTFTDPSATVSIAATRCE